jgi:adenosylcobinamide-phosphate synthase
VALALERFLGYPSPLRRFIGHPANGLYMLNGVFTALVPDADTAAFRRVMMGTAFCLLSMAVTLALAIVATTTLRTFPYAWFWEGLLAVPFLAQYALRVRARPVADALDTDLAAAHNALTHLVNHDLSHLDKSETTRGCLEAVAENTVTAVVTPAFWLALFGLPGIIAISALTAVNRRLAGDHKARMFAKLLDTAANYLPARLTGLLFAGAASMTSPSGGARALEIIWQDAGKAGNLISGCPECAMAGALDIRLGAPASTVKAWQNETGLETASNISQHRICGPGSSCWPRH